jgi:hypothetical protein
VVAIFSKSDATIGFFTCAKTSTGNSNAIKRMEILLFMENGFSVLV